ncbi:MAG: T9SS type A sorting domain-containing protein [Chitinophagaceae bacterium]|nr:T9SS type A sorting domain-containing protein [Chitinophagaceae bacterium]
MKKLFSVLLVLSTFVAKAQTAKVYRGGALLGTYTNLAAASAAANIAGDSILLSAHTFYEYAVPMKAGQTWQGTLTATDTSTIDAQGKGIVGYAIGSSISTGRALNIRDIILTNGLDTSLIGSQGGGGLTFSAGVRDSVALRGHTIVRYCRAKRTAGGVDYAYLFDFVKITHNYSDSCGGGGAAILAFDSSEICYNTAKLGGACGRAVTDGGSLAIYSKGVRVHHNNATLGGGAVYGHLYGVEGQIMDNTAPIGAALYTSSSATYSSLINVKIYNPDASGKRQNELYLTNRIYTILNGAWFGKSDTIGLIRIKPGSGASITGKYAMANWSVNRGKPLTKADTLFPIGAAFTYNDGTALPANALPWLVGNFSSSAGKMLTPNPTMSPTDTLASLFRTYVYPTKGDTTSKPINFVCIVDEDTFRANPRVWGIDSISLSIKNIAETVEVKIYPNPASEVLHIQGAGIGSSIALYDVQGRLVKSDIVNSASLSINIADVAAGNYILKIRNKEGAEGSAKIVKE